MVLERGAPDPETSLARSLVLLITSSFPSLLPSPFAIQMTLLRSLVYPYGPIPAFTVDEARSEVSIVFNENEPPQSAQGIVQRPRIPCCSFMLSFGGNPLALIPISSVVLDDPVRNE
eukprot:gnl/Chilomastix_caulleri/2614.p1 GENE.gnl/Chilomastix_caulleri/2614~~gnl/Chilomastix_caulleri/2614.p1  ORF type:complete len:117 (+),score=17.13 gnl/Chilomastix_caulleri/2614:187-537(+)